MKMNFCTLFDSAYLSRGLIMYESLKEHTRDFHLFIFAFDNLAYEILINLKLSNTSIISLEEFENQALLDIKGSRTRAEYCWTCTSSIINYVFETFDVQSCTYLDADLYFYRSAEILLNEMPAGKSVLITEHRFSRLAQLFEKKRAGRFCVQFITFDNTKEGRSILNKWIGQCIDWCYARYEDGKFGDQKYLENWPLEYPQVHILQNLGGGVAPWNVRQYDFIFKDDQILGKDKKNNTGFEVIFFHFHFVRIMAEGIADLGWNWLPGHVVDGFYKSYINKIVKKEQFLENSFPEYKILYASTSHHGTRELLKRIIKNVTGYNLIKLKGI
jgi:hypothetical protein